MEPDYHNVDLYSEAITERDYLRETVQKMQPEITLLREYVYLCPSSAGRDKSLCAIERLQALIDVRPAGPVFLTSDVCEHVRDTYGVPARVGMRIKIGFLIDGKNLPTTGVIKGADHHLIVLMDGEKKTRRLHPAWCIDYLNSDGTVAAHFSDTD